MAASVETFGSVLESLLGEFSNRRWSGPFTQHDVQALLGVTHNCQGVISQGITAGLFKQVHAGYQLTATGSAELKTLRAGRVKGDENPKHLTSPRRSLSVFTRAMAPVDPAEESGADHDLSKKLESSDATRSTDSTFLERSLHDELSKNLERSNRGGSDQLSKNLESSQPTENTILFECPMDDSQFLESASSFSLFGADSSFSESPRAVCIKNPEGIRKYPNRSNIDYSDHSIDLDHLGTDRNIPRARPRSKLDTTMARESRREDRLGDLRENARKLVGKRSLHTQSPNNARMVGFARALERAVYRYYGISAERNLKNSGFVKPDHFKPEHKMYKLYVKAAQLAEAAGAEYVEFIKAQFYWLEIKKSRAPKLWEIASQYATERWESYRKCVASGRTSVATNVVTRVVQAPVADRHRFERCDGILKALMRNYEVTEADVIRVFALRNDDISFDQDWLEARPVYQQLKAEGAFEE